MKEKAVLRADFEKSVINYWWLTGHSILLFSFIGIPLMPLWTIFGRSLSKRYLKKVSCVLTNKSLKVNRGLLTTIEKTVPLEKITDLALVQGPIMRYFGLHRLVIETAGSAAPGAVVAVTGIKDVKTFREQVLAQREQLGGSSSQVTEKTEPTSHGQVVTSQEIHETLLRIEALLKSNKG